MEIQILEQKKDYIKFNIIGETHTFGNLLRDKINEVVDIDFATYRKAHPSDDQIEIIVQAKKDKDVLKLINSALDAIENEANDFKAKISAEKLDDEDEE